MQKMFLQQVGVEDGCEQKKKQTFEGDTSIGKSLFFVGQRMGH
jgi:hypothetical protein